MTFEPPENSCDPGRDREPAFDLRERTFDFAANIVRLSALIPKSGEARIPGENLVRAGTSAGLHFREANRVRARPEFPARINDCLRELEATAYWLELLVHTRLLPAHATAHLLDETHQLLAILTSIAKKSKPVA